MASAVGKAVPLTKKKLINGQTLNSNSTFTGSQL